MSLLDPVRIPELSPAEAHYQAATMPTGFGEYLGAKLQSGFDFSIAGRATEALTSPSERFGPLPQDTSREDAAAMGSAVDNRRLTEDEWRKLKLDRPGLEFSGGGTVEYETARTRVYDDRRYRDSIIARYQGGLPGQVAGFGAAMLGGLPSPENFVPFVGPSVRAAMVTRMGTIGGRAGVGALDASIGTALADAIVLPDLARRGEDVGAADFALDLALGAVTGGLLGTGAGVLARRADARARQEMLATTSRAVRLDGLERQAGALEIAQRALADDAPVDVGPVLAEALPTIKQRVEQSYIRVYHGSPHRFDRFSMENVGTGEGSQAYGHGLYFSEERAVSDEYRHVLGGKDAMSVSFGGRSIDLQADSLDSKVAARLKNYYRDDINAAVEDYRARLNGAEAAAREDGDAARLAQTLDERAALDEAAAQGIKIEPPGSLYTVDLAASRDELLDWEKPLSEQSAKVREALQRVDDPELRELLESSDAESLTGEQLAPPGSEIAAKFRAAGIKGISYIGEFRKTDGQGARNYVIFDEDLIHIREINDTAIEAPEQPHPSIIEAEASVGQAPPKTGVEEAQRLAKDMGLESPPELDDIKVLKRDGLLSAADEAELERAAETVKDANGWATAYETLSTCVLRYS